MDKRPIFRDKRVINEKGEVRYETEQAGEILHYGSFEEFILEHKDEGIPFVLSQKDIDQLDQSLLDQIDYIELDEFRRDYVG